MLFKSPVFLLLIFVILPAVIVFEQQKPRSLFSSLKLFKTVPVSLKVRLRRLPFYLRMGALIFLLIALAGPRLGMEQDKHSTEGIDIVLTVDASGSMAAEDFTIGSQRVNRLEVVKKVIKEFIGKRPDDRISIVAFAGAAYTVSPLTADKDWARQNVDRISMQSMPDGTAIGSAIMSSLSRLKDSKSKSKIIILLTDGVNNKGEIEPLAAAEAADALNVKIYTIGAGTKGFAPYPVYDPWGQKLYQNVPVDIDEQTLQRIALKTQGEYFRATDTESLEKIYKEIDLLEKTKFEEYEMKNYKEIFPVFLIIALIILSLEILLKRTWLLQLP
jgi:Ca-activated chloride channel family protein